MVQIYDDRRSLQEEDTEKIEKKKVRMFVDFNQLEVKKKSLMIMGIDYLALLPTITKKNSFHVENPRNFYVQTKTSSIIGPNLLQFCNEI